MNTMIQVRNVPDHVHRTLKSRAALAGKSLSDLILDELIVMATLPSNDELKARLRDVEAFVMHESSAELIRKDRDSR